MKYRIVGIGVLLLVFFQFSCEKVIDIPLIEADQTIVVEAILKDRADESYVIVTRTGTVYEETNFEYVNDANVQVFDDMGGSFEFESVGDGQYLSPGFVVVPERKYELKVEVDGKVVTATCQTRSKPKIDSLSYLSLAGLFGIPVDEPLYLVSFHSLDNVNERNFYWMKIFRNGEENRGYYLGNDQLVNGQSYEAQFFGSEADPGDSVFVEMISMDEANYDYLIGLSNNLASGPFAAAPANPPSNLEGGAVGFFGAYTTDTLSIVIPE